MQEEINHKTITVYIRGAKVTAQTLKAALRAILRAREKHKQNVQRREAQYEHEDDVAVNRGKQSLRDLQDEGSELSNIEITDENIKSFERYARKYSIDYALKKDKAADPPRYFVFFRARDEKTMEAAFKEYAEYTTKEKKPSVKKKLVVAVKRTMPQRAREREKKKERTESR